MFRSVFFDVSSSGEFRQPWMVVEKENPVGLHMMGKGKVHHHVPGRKRAALADLSNKVANTKVHKVPGVPWVADEVWERMARHCNRHLKPTANKVSRRGEKPVTYVDTLQRDSRAKDNAERLMHDRKVWRASILESRRSVSTNTAVEDIDVGDSEMPQLCSEYVKDIYAYLMGLEVKQAVRPGYLKGCKITAHMRAVLIDWLIQVHSSFRMLQETLYLTVAILDRFLQVQPVSPNMLQLVGVAALLLASKYEEAQIDAAGIQELADITDNNYTTTQIKQMERVILRRLNFELGRPLPLHFLRRASKAANGTVENHMLAKYFMELTLLDYDMVHYRPSEIAAASLCLSQLLLDGLPWTSTEQHYTTYDEVHLKPVMQHIAKNVVNESITTFQAVKEKYSGSKLMNVTRLSELQLSTVKSLAAPLLGNH